MALHDGLVLLSGERQLVGSGGDCPGRLEVFHSGSWGTVCDDSWDIKDAHVVCRQLQCGVAFSNQQVPAWFGPGSGPIWLDEVECEGNETSLWSCSSSGWGKHDCNHKEDVGVVCSDHVPLRLSGGEGRCSGRLEVYHNAVWGSVCDDHWDISDAQVVCRQLGFFGAGEGVVWLNRAECRGNEVHLWDCPPSLKNHTDCSHKEHAGLTCAESMRVMLVNGSNPCAGRVEVHQNGQWGTVCDWGWDIADAAVVCRELGCGTAVTATFNAHFGAGSGSVSMAFVNCSGSETALKHCSSQNVIAWYCNHSEDAGVVCSDYTNLRLVNGSNSCSGRVERQYFSKWGTVCDACWDMRAASVLCRQLNCGTAVSVVGSDWFGEGSGEIWADVFDCDGNETKLSECSISSWSRAECSHRRDVGFICSDGQRHSEYDLSRAELWKIWQ
uniref:SRCR domain-containing protein n=1 Tax=Cyprinus carpio TaxID=7962 RepID=A0A8C2E5I8_CYPCA